MELIVTSGELEARFLRLLNTYAEFYFATAWAGITDKVFAKLLSRSTSIKQIVVGIHFYQTDPNFLKEFLDDRRVKMIMQPTGTFHPKLYLFYNSDEDWTILVGSANFTHAAFTRNTEAVSLFKGGIGDLDILNKAKSLIKTSWLEGERITKERLERYTERWKIYRRRNKGLHEDDPNIIELPIVSDSWNQYFQRFAEYLPSVEKRCLMLSLSRELFLAHGSLNNMSVGQRRFIGGIARGITDERAAYWQDFGTNGNGKYKTAVIHGARFLSDALDEIPLFGSVTKAQYDSFLEHFFKGFKETWVSSAMRLLVMKRPDVFFSMTDANERQMCEEFSLTRSHVNLDTYWDLVIERIQQCTWWQNPEPKGKLQMQLSECRAAMLDRLFYDSTKG